MDVLSAVLLATVILTWLAAAIVRTRRPPLS